MTRTWHKAVGVSWAVAMATFSCTEPFECKFQPDLVASSMSPDMGADLAPQTATFSCRCVDDQGAPIQDAVVTIAGKTTRTDANGAFTLTDLPVGDVLVTVDGSALEVPDRFEGLPRSYPKIVEKVRLQAGAANGRERPFVLPLGNAPDDISEFLSADGTVRGTEGGIWLYSNANEPACNEDAIELFIPEGTKITFPPGKRRRISLTKVNGDHLPGAPSKVGTPMAIMLLPSGTTFSRPVPLRLPTYSNVPNGQAQEVVSLDYATGDYQASFTGTSTFMGCEITPPKDGGLTTFSFHYARCPAMDIAGQVLDSAGQPRGGVSVQARSFRGLDRGAAYDIPDASATTGADGRYRIDGVRACSVSMVARADLGAGRAVQGTATTLDGSGAKTYDTRLPGDTAAGQRLHVRVKVTGPVNGVTPFVRVRLQGAEGNVLCARPNSQGEVLFRDVLAIPGKFRVASGGVGVTPASLPAQAPSAPMCGAVDALTVELNCPNVSGNGACDLSSRCESTCGGPEPCPRA
jgi:hypothetical protein